MTDRQGITPTERVAKSEPSLLLEVERAAKALARGGRHITYLLRGEPDLPTPPHIVEAAHEAMRSGNTHYAPAEGTPELREAVAGHLSRQQGLTVDASEVLVTTGATMGIYLALQALLEAGDEVLVFGPYYGPYGRIVRLAGGNLVSVPTELTGGRWSVSADRLASHVTPATRALILNTPSNPTGAVLTAAELRAIADVAASHGLAIISDECYDTIIYDGKQHKSIASLAPEVQDRTIIINSFSKSYAMTGWRLGYAVARREILGPMRQLFNASGRCAASFTQRAGAAALNGPQEPVTEMAASYARRRQVALDELAGLKFPFAIPEGTFYFFVDCRSLQKPSLELAMHVLEAGGVGVTPGRFFGEHGEGYLRLSYAVGEEDFRRGMQGVVTALNAL